MSATDRTAGLRAARTKDSQAKRQRVLVAIDALESAGAPITAAAVATTAGVSTWLVYADGVKEHLDAARHRQATQQPALAAASSGPPATSESVHTDLTIARAEIGRLRAEHDKLRGRLRLQLGAEIEGPDRAELIERVATLEAVNRQLVAARDARAAEVIAAHRHVRELEDDLTAARESLRQLIKDQNR
jgi:hypothetical protein